MINQRVQEKLFPEVENNSRSGISAVQRELTFEIHTAADVSNTPAALL